MQRLLVVLLAFVVAIGVASAQVPGEKITQVPTANPLSGPELIPAVQNGATVATSPTAIAAFIEGAGGGVTQTNSVTLSNKAVNARNNTVPGLTLTADDFGAKCDGVTDDTTALTAWVQSAQPYTTLSLRAGVTCMFNPGLNTGGMLIGSTHNFVIEGNGATIKAIGSAGTTGAVEMLQFYNVQNAAVRNLTIDGNVAARGGTAACCNFDVYVGELSARILFDHVRMLNSPMDGFYISPGGAGSGTQSHYPADITVRDSDAIGNFRNGMSAIGSVRLTVRGGNYSSQVGEAPQGGIDVEPDSSTTFGNTDTLIDGTFADNNAGNAYSVTATTVFNYRVRLRNLEAQGNGGSAVALGNVKDIDIGPLYVSNSTAAPVGYVYLTASSGLTDVYLHDLNFNNITPAGSSGALIYTHAAVVDRVFIDGVYANTVNLPIITANSPVTVMNVSAKNVQPIGGNAEAINAVGATNQYFKNISIDGTSVSPGTAGAIGFFSTGANLVLENATFKDAGSAAATVYITGANAILRNTSVIQTASIPGPAFKFTVAPKLVQNCSAQSAGTDYTSTTAWAFTSAPATSLVSGCAPMPVAYTPTVSSGFGTAPSIASGSVPSSFSVNVGTGGSASSGVIGLPTAPTGWSCHVADVTTPAANMSQQIGSSTTTVTLTNYVRTTGVAGAWPASDILQVGCSPN